MFVLEWKIGFSSNVFDKSSYLFIIWNSRRKWNTKENTSILISCQWNTKLRSFFLILFN